MTLPLTPPPVEIATVRDDTVPASGRLVLLSEDNVDTCESVSAALEVMGHRVRVVHDGMAGIAAAHEFRPDVVLCDIGLPDLDGCEVARRLRADEAFRSTRLIALSGYARPRGQGMELIPFC